MARFILPLLLVLVATVSGYAQRLHRELICEYRSPVSRPKAGESAVVTKLLSSDIVHLTFPSEEMAAKHYARLLADSGVRAVQYNFRVQPRSVPNDPQYPRQTANFTRAGFEDAWDLTTGGTTAEGTPIVTAILDAGFDVDHEDLVGSLWRNVEEVAGDGLDNDGNGYVDDVHGWNFVDGVATYDIDSHGTAVAGLLGAAGNNGIGVTGTNWDADLMLFQISTVAEIISAYEYIINQRRRHNESGGAGGSFVVATNASFGIEGATCDEYPVWGSMYDRLGEVGILTAASVSNVAEDVDTYGDMPTDCPSPYILGVTNLDADDRLFPSSAYGAVAVDLAAPGEGSFTTRPNDTYSNFGSTSAAAPYVTGAISLLYATPCQRLLRLSREDPPAAARLVRETLLSSVRARVSLQRRTVTGGSLDVASAQLALLDNCGEDTQPFDVLSIYPNPSDGRFRIETSAVTLSAEVSVRIIDLVGRSLGLAQITPVAGRAGSLETDLSKLPAGIYLLRISDGDRQAVARAIIR